MVARHGDRLLGHLLCETALSELIRALWLPGDMRGIYSRIRRAATRCMR